MTITKSELIELIKRRLGFPLIKVELTDTQIEDAIDYSRDRFIKVAIGNAVQEEYITVLLSGGQATYDLLPSIKEVVAYTDGVGGGSFGGSINTLFTIENYFYSQGMLANIQNPFDLIGYHIALDFLETLSRYVHSKYQWTYNKFKNQLTLTPTPPVSGGYIITGYTSAGEPIYIDSPGFALLRVFKLEAEDEDIYSEQTVQDYAFALSMRTLGIIRRKFSSFASVGNQGISLDGSELISEADTMIEKLEERLRDEDCHMGYGISMG
jgi:hypothetical protein